MKTSASTESEDWWERDRLSPLHIAAYTGNVDAVRALLGEGAKVDAFDAQGNTPLYWACFKGKVSREYVEVVRALLTSGAAVNRCGPDTEPPLFAACRAGAGEIVHELIKAGADVRQSSGNRAPIAVAAQAGNVECVKALLAAGADPASRGAFGLTARELAESNGFDEIVAALNAVEEKSK